MEKRSALLVLKNCFKEEGQIAFVHFIDGSNILINNMPNFLDLIMEVKLEYAYGDDEITDICYVPYSSIMYITVTTTETIKKLSEFNEELKSQMGKMTDIL